MPATTAEPHPRAVPLLRYRDLPAAIDWLCSTLGFEKQRILHDEEGSVTYAQLTGWNAVIMLAPVKGSVFDDLMVQPDEVRSAETQAVYFFVPDVGSHYARLKSVGADIVLDITDGRERGYSCRDPEGHIWNFGTFDPWCAPSREHWGQRKVVFASALSACLSAIAIGLAMFAYLYAI